MCPTICSDEQAIKGLKLPLTSILLVRHERKEREPVVVAVHLAFITLLFKVHFFVSVGKRDESCWTKCLSTWKHPWVQLYPHD